MSTNTPVQTFVVPQTSPQNNNQLRLQTNQLALATNSLQTQVTTLQTSTSGLTTVTNSNGTYMQLPDGTYFQWGEAASVGGGGSTAVTFPIAFATGASIVLTNPSNAAGNIVTVANSITKTGFSAEISGVVFVGGTGTTPTGSEKINWLAIGM